MFSLNDKVIVITGGSGLLGSEMVRRLRGAGATVINADLNFPEPHAHQQVMDITEESSVQDAVARIVDTYGCIDGWVNNAYPRTADWVNKFEDISLESWRRNVDMHLNGYFLCCQTVLGRMKARGRGSLINMSSIYGVQGPDFSVYEGTQMTSVAGYAAIKGGITNLTRYLAAYFGPHGIRVNAVSPGGIFDNQPEPFLSNYNKKVPLKRMGSPADISAAVHFLLSDDASYITGHNLIVDGGWSVV